MIPHQDLLTVKRCTMYMPPRTRNGYISVVNVLSIMKKYASAERATISPAADPRGGGAWDHGPPLCLR